MNKFGKIKSNIENILIESYNTKHFNFQLKKFQTYILKNKQISEAYVIYDELMKKKGISNDIVEDYLNESILRLRSIMSVSDFTRINEWIDQNQPKNTSNNYEDIDMMVYNTSFNSLEKVLECKRKIKDQLVLKEEENNINESINIPLSSMLKIITNTFNKEYSHISEEEKKELKELFVMNKKELKEEIENTKKSVLNKLTSKLNESDDSELNDKLNMSISKINESDISLISLYKLRQLDQGL